MNLIFNTPNVWITINLSDTQDPIAQVFCRTSIDLDEFSKTAGPTSNQRAENVASDPFASVRFFHVVIKIIIEELFGIKKRGNHIERKDGILGTVQCYIGTVEAQGRGSLHLHMLLWLKEAPPASTMQKALATNEFRDRVQQFIRAMIHADIEGKSAEEVKYM